MVDFVRYQIDNLKKWLSGCRSESFKLDFDFVLYCEQYIKLRGKLSTDLYSHLNNLFWTYRPDD